MRVERFDGEEIETNWPWLAQLLAPAIREDKNRTIRSVKAALLSGTMGIASLHAAEGAGLIVIEPNGLHLWITHLAAKVNGGPRQWLRVMRGGLAMIEQQARLAGMTEVRFGGRDWSFAFPDYERYDDTMPNRLRKVL